jgi:hypothetical protein
MAQRLPASQPQGQSKPAGGRPGGRPTGGATLANAAAQQRLAAKANAGQDDDEQEEIYEGDGFAGWLGDQVSWITSMVVHVVLLLVMALYVIGQPPLEAQRPIVVNDAIDEEIVEEVEKLEIDESAFKDLAQGDPAEIPEAPASDMPQIDNLEEGADSASQELSDDGLEVAEPNDILKEGIGSGTADGTGTGKGLTGSGAGLGGRGDRRKGAGGLGASKESESAVDAALKWLSEHQLADGSWSFDHRDGGQCQGRCKNQGSMKAAKNGATGLALMAFLGAGQSHVEGKYQNTVAGGVRFLLSSLKDQGADGGSWYDNVGNATAYSHGIASLAMCEAYAMAKDFKPRKKPEKSPSEMTEEERKKWAEDKKKEKDQAKNRIVIDNNRLRAAAQASLNYIMNVQHAEGGWRYNPKVQPGDTSVVGWMVMALKSGYMADLKINPHTVKQASHFLDLVARGDYKEVFWYMKDNEHGNSRATTAIGLLCRMYMGMDRNSGTIREGVHKHLDKWGPDLGGNMYYNYYATQVVFHYGEEPWKKWNKSMRDFLVNSQSKRDDHDKGSWHFNEAYAAAGGRLYCTAMSAMTLEVYYRYLPIYRKGAEGDFDKADGGAKPAPKKPGTKPPADKKTDAKNDDDKKTDKKSDSKKEDRKSDAKKSDSKKSDSKKSDTKKADNKKK